MLLGKVIGHATATVKHESFVGLRFVLVQPLNAKRLPEMDPLVAVDRLGSGVGDTVVLNCDVRAVGEVIGNPKTPGRWFVIGIADD